MCAQHVLLLSLTSGCAGQEVEQPLLLMTKTPAWSTGVSCGEWWLLCRDLDDLFCSCYWSLLLLLVSLEALLPSTLHQTIYRPASQFFVTLHLSPFRSVSSLPQTSSIFPLPELFCRDLHFSWFAYSSGNDSRLKSWCWGLFVVDSVVLIEFLRQVGEQEQEHVAVIDL